MSITKAQALAEADGFLDSVGSSNDVLKPRESIAEIFLLAGELIEVAQENLIRGNNIAGGFLSESLLAGDPVVNGKNMRVDIYMNFYGRFINKGVKGTKSGSSKVGYSFKNDIVGKNMLAAIKAWLDRGKLSTSNVKKYTPHGNHERKMKGLGSLAEADASYAVARSIKQKGIKPTGFMDMAISTTQRKVQDRLGAALKIDITNSLSDF